MFRCVSTRFYRFKAFADRLALTVRVVWNRFYIDSIVHCTQNKHVINNVLFSIRMNIVFHTNEYCTVSSLTLFLY